MFQTISNRFDPIPVVMSRDSLTVPDMSFTPREIIQKFSRGEKVPLGFNGLYDSEDDADHLFDDDPSVFEEDPTRDPNFDQADYVEEKIALDERMSERKRRSNGKSISDSERKASDDEPNASEARKRETTSGESDIPPSGQSNE